MTRPPRRGGLRPRPLFGPSLTVLSSAAVGRLAVSGRGASLRPCHDPAPQLFMYGVCSLNSNSLRPCHDPAPGPQHPCHVLCAALPFEERAQCHTRTREAVDTRARILQGLSMHGPEKLCEISQRRLDALPFDERPLKGARPACSAVTVRPASRSEPVKLRHRHSRHQPRPRFSDMNQGPASRT